jgi:nicotinamidase-related amidase
MAKSKRVGNKKSKVAKRKYGVKRSNKMMRRKGKVSMRRRVMKMLGMQKGGISYSVLNAMRGAFGSVNGGDNLYKMWSAFFYRKVKQQNKNSIIITELPSLREGNKKHLYVIDMQNDFVDREMPEGDEQLTGPPYGATGKPIGSFAVGQGKDMISDLISYILTAKDSPEYANIVLSRDYHPSDHCSFGGPKEGYFPPHCIQSTIGAQFIPEILAMKDQLLASGKTTVIFKGFDTNVDSFAGESFDANQKSSGPGCSCGEKSCSEAATGGWITGNPGLNWEQNAGTVSEDSSTPFNLNPSQGDIIEVCGLAGDYCVRDTALALKQKYPQCSVVVLNHLTRYAFLPTQIFLTKPGTLDFVLDDKGEKIPVGAFPQHQQGSDGQVQSHLADGEIQKFWSDDKTKGFNYYLFTPPPQKLLSGEEYKNAKPDPAKTDPVKLENDIKQGNYFHFITDHNTLIQDYETNGVKMYIPSELVQEIDAATQGLLQVQPMQPVYDE